MKKIFLALVALFSMVNIAMASDDVVLTSGSLAELNAGQVKVCVVWDYSNSTLEGNKPETFLAEKGEDWVKGYPKELKNAEAVFAKQLNKKSKTVTLVDDSSAADYVMTIKMGDFHYGSTSLSFMIGFGTGDAHMSADITVTKGSTTVATIKADGVPGPGIGNETRRSNAYLDLAKWMVKLIKKAK